MIHKTIIALSIALVLESVALGASAFAYSGPGGGAFGTFRRDHSLGSARIADQGFRGAARAACIADPARTGITTCGVTGTTTTDP